MTMTYIEQVLDGTATAEDIDDFVDSWHDGSDDRQIHDYLGLTWEEYSNWVIAPDSLNHIIAIRRLTKAAMIDVTHEAAKQTGNIN